ncbi:MAG: EF-hand domain-containing protein [Chloroflexi bacterium]|nr:EF-hand domain-containing protein [Chloroflexota bacterium]
MSVVTPDVIEPMLKNMQDSLNELAMRWRGSDSDEEADAIAHNYQVILRCMIDLGFRQSLQVEAELPDELMPQEYFDLYKEG